MARLILTRALAAQVDDQLEHDVDGQTVRGALDALFAQYPRLRSYVLTDAGAVRQHVNVFLNDSLVEDRRRLSDTVASDDTIHIIQAVSGGAA